MNEVTRLETRLTEQEKFIKNILLELGEVYDLVSRLKAQAEMLNEDFQLLLKDAARAS